MHCPDCATLLKAAPDAVSEGCPACGGVWFELPALMLALRRGAPAERGVATPPEGPAVSPVRRCPICRAALRWRDWAGSAPPQPLALCPLGHGAWLPSGHLARLREGASRARRLLTEQGGYFTLLAHHAALGFERATRAGRAAARRRAPLARLLGSRL